MKIRFMKKSILAVVLLLAPLMADTGVLMEKSLTAGSGGLLTVESMRGSIEVETGSGDNVHVKVLFKSNSGREVDIPELLEELDLKIEQQGKNVTVTTRQNDSGWSWNDSWKRVSIQYVITVPQKYNVDLTTAGGSISIEDLDGDVLAETAGGSLSFGKISGKVRGHTAGGSISLDGCNGVVDVRTAGGSINIGDVDGDVNATTAGGSINIDRAAGNVVAETSGGSINVEEVMGNIRAETSGGSVNATISKQPKGDCKLTTSGGSVTVYLAEDIAVDLDAKAGWGKVQSDFAIDNGDGRQKSVLRGKINGGGPELYLRTSSGKVKVLKR